MTLKMSGRPFSTSSCGAAARARGAGKAAGGTKGCRCHVAFAMAALLLSSACAVQPPAPTAAAASAVSAVSAVSAPPPAAASRAAVRRLLVLNCERSTDCATVGVGARACGGPEAYLAYAVAPTPSAALQQAVEKDRQLRKKELEARGEMSTCEVLPDPGALCTPAGLCVLQTQRSPAGGALLR